MRKIIPVTLFLFLFSFPILSKTPGRIDSLAKVLRTQKDTFRLHTLIKLSQEYLPVNIDSALFYARMLVREAEQSGIEKRTCEAYLIVGSAFHRFPDLDSDFFYKRKAVTLGEKIGYRKMVAKAYNDLGLYEKERSNYKEALELIIRSAEIVEELKDEKSLGVSYMNIAYIMHSQQEEDQAIPYYRKALAIFKKTKKPDNCASVLLNLGSIYDDRKQYDTAMTMYSEAFRICDSIGNKAVKSQAMVNIGVLNRHLGKYDVAVKWLEGALVLKREMKDIDGISVALLDMAQLSRLRKQYAQAEKYLAESETAAFEARVPEQRRDIYGEYAALYTEQGRFADALKYMTKQTTLKDSIMSAEKQKALTEMKTKYDSEKKERENILLRQEAQVNQQKAQVNQLLLEQEQSHKYMLYAGIAALALLLSLAFYAYYQDRKSNRLLTEKNEQVNRYNRTLKELNTRLIESEDQLTQLNNTKDRLFSVVSHDISNPVKAMANYNQALLAQLDKLDREQLAEAVKKINQSIQPLQGLVDNLLHWSMVQKKGLQPKPEKFDLAELAEEAIRLYDSYAAQKNVSVRFDSEKNSSITADKNMVRLVIRNILGNALKYSPPGSSVEISIVNHTTGPVLRVRDKGKGISPGKIKQILAGEVVTSESGTAHETGTGLGLTLVSEYLRMNRGEMKIESAEATGTVFEISFQT
ncbi:MAG: ATP-binding domain-containing protein [Bacteroidetes bacterium]|nr:MAG: ATP-binding domain-containing protein [Bacteroidota bacterium]